MRLGFKTGKDHLVKVNPPLVTVIDKTTDPAQRLRNEWGASLAEHLAGWYDQDTGIIGMTRKRLVAELADLGIEVSKQAVSGWLNGGCPERSGSGRR